MQILKNVLWALWDTTTEMSPYLLLGFGVAGLLSMFLSRESVEKHLGGRGILPVLKASLFGVPLPLCSCGVIPVSASLRKHGSSRGATVAFLISTPQTGVDSILVTYSLLGPVFALLRPIVAFFSGIAGGWAADAIESEGDGDASRSAAPCEEACCTERHLPGRFRRAMKHGFVTLPGDIGGAMVAGLLIAALISALVPDEWLGRWVGGGIGSMLIMMLLGIPVYVCATASVPIAAALIAKGVSPGAALVFLMTGPATNAAAVATLWKILGRKTALVYLGTVAATALLAGMLVDALIPNTAAMLSHGAHHAMPAWVGTASAMALAAVFVYSAWVSRGKRENE